MKITCPECGAAMNHHAVKVEYSSEQPANSAFDGVLRNIHTCPECGEVEVTTED